ncbi:MAG: DUF4369 domain-containing protein [Bacteroidales bacterium]|nr:DUF4369 domain-containing protein [Candidatus Minthousia equi]
MQIVKLIITCCFFTVLCALFGCTGLEEHTLIKGKFENLREGELYFYSAQGMRNQIDTVTIHEGKFTYQLPVTKPGYTTMIFPNMSQQVVFVAPGLEVNIQADATNLKGIKIDGGELNKEMTEFRAGNQDASQHIKSHPTSLVSTYLFQKYYIQQSNQLKQARELATILQKAQPQNAELASLTSALNQRKLTDPGQKAPAFTINDYTGKEHSLSDYKDHSVLLCFWSTYAQDSRDAQREMKTYFKENEKPKDLDIINISLDIQKMVFRGTFRDSIPGIHCCDLHGFDNPMVQAYSITELPTYILINPNGNIKARKYSFEDIKKEL